MKKINLAQVFETLNRQLKDLNRCLGLKNKTYQQIISSFTTMSDWQKWQVIAHLKSSHDILTLEEDEKLWSMPKLAKLAKIIENVIYNLKYEPHFYLDSDSFYLLRRDFELFCLWKLNVAFDFVLLPYKQEFQVYEFVISDVFLKSIMGDKSFIYSAETEFIAGFYQDKCFVVRIVSDIKKNKMIKEQIHKRYECGLFLSKFQPQNLKLAKAQMLELRKRLMLWMEYKKNILFPCNLGDIGLIEMAECYSDIGLKQWRQILNMLLINKHVFPRNLWKKLSDLNIYDGVFDGVKMMLQKFNGTPNLVKNVSYFYFVNDTQKAAVRIFWRQGWMAEMFVQSAINLEFPVLTDDFVYFVKTVKNLRQEPLLAEMFADNEFYYIWN